MSMQDLVISMDAHTHSFIDLKPYLARTHHAAFDAATEVGRRIFFEANRMWGELLHDGGSMHWDMDPTINTSADQYNLELTVEQRLRNVEADGISAEFIIDGNGPVSTDPDLLHAVTLAYNRWFRDYTAPAPGRFAGAVIVNLIAGIDTVIDEIRDAHAHGLKAIHLSGQPQMSSTDLPPYSHRMYEPMWATLNELHMPLVFHGGVGREKPLLQWGVWGNGQRGWEDLAMLEISSGNFQALTHLLLASVPERYPNIHFGWIETGSHWIPPLLRELDGFMKCRRSNPAMRMNMTPSEMWRRQCFSAGPLGASEIALLDQVGVENLMFGSDYIHVEGTYPHSRSHLDMVLGGLSAEQRFAICAGNAARVLGFDLEFLAETSPAQENPADKNVA
jgi:predicted TIM-barrel fold metal-dependent hydrolase